MTKHPYLTQEMFADPTFLKVRRQVARLLLPHSEPASQEQLRRLIELYDEMIGDKPAK